MAMFRSLLLAVAVIGAGCVTEAYADGLDQTSPTSAVAQPAAAEAASGEASGGSSGAAPVPQPASPEVARNPLAAQIVELPSAGGIPEVDQRPIPVSMSFDKIGVDTAPIDPAGVLDNGEMQIPGARQVGWYEYGPTPGETGSAVLAAHIAFDGERGIFRFLSDSEVGDRFTVGFDDGSQQTYEIFERAQYGKRELPFDRVFARDGSPVVTLISCGGTFQPALSSYEDNIVAYAAPVD